MLTRLFDQTVARTADGALGFIGNILQACTEYSIVCKDLDGKILLWNEGARRLYGYEPEEVVGKANASILHLPRNAGSVGHIEIRQTALRDGKWEGATTQLRKNGEKFLARLVLTPCRDTHGTPVGYLAISHDVSREQRFVEELHRTRLFADSIVVDDQGAISFIISILESSTEYSIIAKDLDGKIILWNEGARRLYGYEPEEVVGKANASILHSPADVKSGRDIEILRTALHDGKWEGTLDRVRKDGEVFTTRAVITPRRDHTGRAVGYLLISKDLSDEIRMTETLKDRNRELLLAKERLEQTNEALVRSNAELKQFAYIASHDLQTPLRNICGFVQLLHANYAGALDEQANDWIGRTVQCTQQMHTLIQDVLAYSRVDSQALPLQPTPFREVFNDAVALLEAPIQEADGQVTCDELPTVAGDRAQLAQLMQNLIGNALKYHGSEPPRVHVSARPGESEWIFSVRDNGIGITAKHHERIFEIFRRLHNQQEYPGTGIGLAICRRVVHRHGGRIWVESEAGRGSTFYFTIPERTTGLS
jgi:PAS domain S-box-containing protein